MRHDPIEDQVRAVLRESNFATKDVDVGLSEPLADLGLLDSLALVEFVTAVEVKFQVELPSSIWSTRHELTLGRIVDAIAELRPNSPKDVPNRTVPTASAVTASEAADSRVLKLAYAIRERGLIRGTAWVVARFVSYLKRLFLVRDQQLLLEFDLRDQMVAPTVPATGMRIREATEKDIPELSDLFAAADRAMSEQTLRDRMQDGFTCFVAVDDKQIVGMTWISRNGEDNCPFTGLHFRMLPNSCYALDLYERESHTRKGVGLSLLTHGLVEAKSRGFDKQVTTVDVTNTKMLTAAVHMSGFVKVGDIRTTWLLRRPLSRWTIGGRAGRGRVVTR